MSCTRERRDGWNADVIPEQGWRSPGAATAAIEDHVVRTCLECEGQILLDVVRGELEADRNTAGPFPDRIGKAREIGRRFQILDHRRRHRILARLDPAHLGNLRGDLGTGKYPADTGLRALATLEVKGLDLVEQILGVAVARWPQLEEVARVLRLFLRQHPALSRTDPGTGLLGAPRECDLGLAGQRAKAHVRNQQRHFQAQRAPALWPDDQSALDIDVISQRPARQLRGENLDIIPGWRALARHAHRNRWPLAADLVQPPACEGVDEFDMGFGVGVAWRRGGILSTAIAGIFRIITHTVEFLSDRALGHLGMGSIAIRKIR